MALSGVPVLGGVELRRPQTRTRSSEPVESEVELAAGGLRRYSRGVRAEWSLSWRNLPEADAGAVDAACKRRGPLSFVDQDGTTATVLVDTYSGLEAVPGTEPPRYGASVTLRAQGAVR